jgi:hypothetical protein
LRSKRLPQGHWRIGIDSRHKADLASVASTGESVHMVGDESYMGNRHKWGHRDSRLQGDRGRRLEPRRSGGLRARPDEVASGLSTMVGQCTSRPCPRDNAQSGQRPVDGAGGAALRLWPPSQRRSPSLSRRPAETPVFFCAGNGAARAQGRTPITFSSYSVRVRHAEPSWLHK